MELPQNLKLIHEKALRLTKNYKSVEAELLEAIIQVREEKVYRYFECTSVFEYCVKILKLDAGVVYGFTAVANKIKEVPELKTKIQDGSLNVSTAKRITSVLTPQNKTEWFEKAETLSMRKLEKEVATVNPKMEVREKASYLNSKRVSLQLGLDEKIMLKLRRIQDLESQKQRRSLSLEDIVGVLAEEYLDRHDPVQKAKRAEIRGKLISTQPTTNPSTWKDPKTQLRLRAEKYRTPVPSHLKHQVYLRDQGKCQHVKSFNNQKCESSRFIEIHHKKPVSQGGGNEVPNLITLCSEHHKMMHIT